MYFGTNECNEDFIIIVIEARQVFFFNIWFSLI
jgi:hypothetical protein